MIPANELAAMRTTVFGSFDVTVTWQRKSVASDGYGSGTETWNTLGTLTCNIIKPSAAMIQEYAARLSVTVSLMIRYNPTNALAVGDRIRYAGKFYTVELIENAESYTVANDAILSAVQ